MNGRPRAHLGLQVLWDFQNTTEDWEIKLFFKTRFTSLACHLEYFLSFCIFFFFLLSPRLKPQSLRACHSEDFHALTLSYFLLLLLVGLLGLISRVLVYTVWGIIGASAFSQHWISASIIRVSCPVFFRTVMAVTVLTPLGFVKVKWDKHKEQSL